MKYFLLSPFCGAPYIDDGTLSIFLFCLWAVLGYKVLICLHYGERNGLALWESHTQFKNPRASTNTNISSCVYRLITDGWGNDSCETEHVCCYGLLDAELDLAGCRRELFWNSLIKPGYNLICVICSSRPRSPAERSRRERI